jgi:hypothetical protein
MREPSMRHVGFKLLIVVVLLPCAGVAAAHAANAALSARAICALAPALSQDAPDPTPGDTDAPETEKIDLNAPAEPGEIARLIEALADPQYETREWAFRRLCALGPAARGAIEQAARDEHPERALRARKLLQVLDDHLLAGVSVALRPSAEQFTWQTPIDMVVELTNDSAFPARVPFVLDAAERKRLNDDGRQVGDLLDLGEWLAVHDAKGRRIDIRIDDPHARPAVAAALEKRLDDPPVSVLSPGASTRLTVRAFNRGLARYPLLEQGRYTVVFDYVPAWEDERLRTQGVGRVRSNQVELTVTRAAPPTVARDGREITTQLTLEGDAVVARLVNGHDRAVVANVNFGPEVPFAQRRWVVPGLGQSIEVPVHVTERRSYADFDAQKLIRLEPGASVEVDRIPLVELRGILGKLAGAKVLERVPITFRYANLCDKRWQDHQPGSWRKLPDLPDVLRTPLPPEVLSTAVASDAVFIDMPAREPGKQLEGPKPAEASEPSEPAEPDKL